MTSPWIRARVMDISDRRYTQAVMGILERARKEIVLSFYLVEPNDEAGPAHPVNRFLDALLRAKNRGVRVQILLNTNFRYAPKSSVSSGKYFQQLLAAGAEITTLLPGRRLHDKLLIVDKRYVIDGSMNWSVAALVSNFESAVLIDSPALAKLKLTRIERIANLKLSEKKSDRPLLLVPEKVLIPEALLEIKYLPSMIRTSDQRAFDLYLTLRGQAAASGKKDLGIDLEVLGPKLGLPPSWKRSALRRQMIKTLKKLEKPYQLLKAGFPYAGNPKVTLTELPGNQIEIPGYLLEADYLSKTSSPETFLELVRIKLKTQGEDLDSLSAPELEKRFGVGKSSVIDARKKSKEGVPLPDV